MADGTRRRSQRLGGSISYVDRLCLQFLCEQKVATARDVAMFRSWHAGYPEPIGVRATNKFVQKLVRLGFVEAERVGYRGSSLVAVTRAGVRAVGLSSKFAPRTPFKVKDLSHTLTLAALRNVYECRVEPWAFTSEAVLEHGGWPHYRHRPDGLVVKPVTGALVAVECELTMKSRDRTRDTMRELLHFGEVHYWASSNVSGFLHRVADASLSPEERARIAITELGTHQRGL